MEPVKQTRGSALMHLCAQIMRLSKYFGIQPSSVIRLGGASNKNDVDVLLITAYHKILFVSIC